MTDLHARLAPFFGQLWIDRIVSFEPHVQIVAIKNLSFNDAIFHTVGAGNPQLPFGLLFESFTQLVTYLFLNDPEYHNRIGTIHKVLHFEVIRPAVPGDQLRLELDILKIKDTHITCAGRCLVEGRVIASGEFEVHLDLQPSKPQIHPTASVHASAYLGKDVVIGPFSIVGENVTIGDNTIIEANVMIEKWTTIGTGCHIHFGCVIGSDPQDVKYKGEKTWVVIGDRNEIREYVTINRSTGKDTVTQVGSDNIFLTHVHIAHNCKIGNQVIIANMTNLGGHTEVGDQATIGGMTGIHQFVRIGQGAMVGAYTRLPQDVPPYTLCEGNPAFIRGLNLVGMKRRGIPRPAIAEIKDIFAQLYRSGRNTTQALQELRSHVIETPEAQLLFDFVQTPTTRGILKKDVRAEVDSDPTDD